MITKCPFLIISARKKCWIFGLSHCPKKSINFKEVNWVFFEFPILPSLRKNVEPESKFYDFGKDIVTKMGCIIVNADHLLNCLSYFDPQFVNKIQQKFLSSNDSEYL